MIDDEMNEHIIEDKICKKCMRNASPFWWRCCPLHVDPDNLNEVVCYDCVYILHPDQPEFDHKGNI